jgi:hypothetical protein
MEIYVMYLPAMNIKIALNAGCCIGRSDSPTVGQTCTLDYEFAEEKDLGRRVISQSCDLRCWR